jgi:hypothetical protein
MGRLSLHNLTNLAQYISQWWAIVKATEISGSTKDGKFLGKLSDYHLVMDFLYGVSYVVTYFRYSVLLGSGNKSDVVSFY